MTELVTSGSVGGMVSNGCLYPEVKDSLEMLDKICAPVDSSNYCWSKQIGNKKHSLNLFFHTIIHGPSLV